MPLNEKQRQAVEYLEGPLLVLAGPGTGKTQLLSSKVQYILENTDTAPENILCLTFTDSGAENMRSRLKSLVGPAANKVNIYTYHAFGSTILAEYKNYATEFTRNLDSAIDAVAQYKLIESIQGRLDTFDIMKRAKISDIIETISAAKSACLSGKDLSRIATENIRDSVAMNPELNKCLKNVKKGMKFNVGLTEVYLPIMEVLKSYIGRKPLAPGIDRIASTLLFELNSIIETEEKKEKPSISPLTSWKNKRFELDENGDYRLKDRVANKKLLSLSIIMQDYEAALAESGRFDFADMLQQAIKILHEDEGFKLTLEERFQYILLDEFQDTNPAQAELIYALTDYEQPQVMAVGDDDQAIFAFQGANASNLYDFQQHYGAEYITLVDNYRSHSEILDTSFRIREQIEGSFAKENNIVKRLRASRATGASIERHEFIEPSAEYHWLSEKIAALIRSGTKASEIAIITPKHKYVTPLLPYLKHRQIQIAYEKRDNLFEDEKLHQLLTLAQFIYELSQGQDPAHRLLEILTFPFFGFSPLAAVQAVERKPGKISALDYLLGSDDPDLHDAAELFSALVAKSFHAPLELLLDYLTGAAEIKTADGKILRSNFLNYYAEKEDYQTFSLYENLHVLREAVVKYAAEDLTPAPATETATKSAPQLKDLIKFVGDYTSAGVPLSSTSPYQDSADAVQVLTAHKSKGLEFEHVFLISTDDQSWGNAKGNNNFLSLPQNVVSIRHTGVTDDERRRLFFVALTRAKSHLYLTSSLKDFSGKSPARLEYLSEYEDPQTGKIISPYLPEKSREVIRHYDGLPEDQKLSDLQTSWLSHYVHTEDQLRPVLEKRLENYKLTATDLTNFIDVVYAGPQEFYRSKILRAPEESYSAALTFGNLIHATFEAVTNQHLDDAAALEFYKDAVRAANVPEEDLEELMERGTKSLAASLKQFGPLLRANGARAEVNFYQEHLALGDIPLTGKIDHINIDEQNKTIEVFDFKTSGFKDKKWGSHPTLYKYMLQLGFYKLLLNLSPAYSKYKVTKAHILFVVPDSAEAKVHDKIYEYNDTDEEELKALAHSVYAHIKSLDFLDDPDLFIPPNDKQGIKEIREFIELILAKNPGL